MDLMTKKDALGNPVRVGADYGFTVDSNGVTSITLGSAVKENEKTVTIEVKKYSRALWTHEAKDYEVTRKKVAVKAVKLFPVNLKG